MALSAFDNKSEMPGEGDLKKTLGQTSTHWNNLVTHIADTYAPTDEMWNFAGANWGWSLRLKQKKRTILYMTPCQGYFLVGFVLGDKAVQAAYVSDLPDSVLAAIREARKYAEGKAVRIEIRNKKDLEIAKKLTAIKMAN